MKYVKEVHWMVTSTAILFNGFDHIIYPFKAAHFDDRVLTS
jgi:hypothetical protein